MNLIISEIASIGWIGFLNSWAAIWIKSFWSISPFFNFVGMFVPTNFQNGNMG